MRLVPLWDKATRQAPRLIRIKGACLASDGQRHDYFLPLLYYFQSIPAKHFNMGILSRKAPPPTALDLGDASQPPVKASGDPEKVSTDIQHEDRIIVEHTQAVDPELERRVVRKLDWHLPPLVAFLCKPGPLNYCRPSKTGDVVCASC